jgi:hypothetical protein
MIKLSENQQKVKIVHINYPDISIIFLDGNSKKVSLNYGIVSTTMDMDKINWDLFGGLTKTTLDGIQALCIASLSGQKLTKELFDELNIRENELCSEEL